MDAYRFTTYFEEEVLRQRPYIRRAWCVAVIENPVRVEQQRNGRLRFRGLVPGLERRNLRALTLDDRITIHNALPDRRFHP